MLRYPLVILFLLWSAVPTVAQTELSFYGGFQSSPHSRVRAADPGGIGTASFLAAWESRSLTAPPYYGVRAIWWSGTDLGWGLDFSHDKVYADSATLTDNGLSTLEFSDGLNVLTFNAFRRWPESIGDMTPYVGAGVGVTLPHVEFDSGAGLTFEYQIGGPAVSIVAGMNFPLNDNWALFAEYKGTYSRNNVDLVSGGTLDTNIVTNSLNFGTSFGF